MFEIRPLSIPGAFEIKNPIFRDGRGSFCKTVHREQFQKLGLSTDFAEQFYTVSKRNVLRGLHFQTPPYEHNKLVYCVFGQILDVVVDLRRSSPQYGQVASLRLDSDGHNSVYIPRGCAHGFLSLSEDSVVSYAVTSVHSPQHDSGILWKSIPFDWGIANPVLSSRDQQFVGLSAFESPFA